MSRWMNGRYSRAEHWSYRQLNAFHSGSIKSFSGGVIYFSKRPDTLQQVFAFAYLDDIEVIGAAREQNFDM